MHLFLLIPRLDRGGRMVHSEVVNYARAHKIVLSTRIENSSHFALNEKEIQNVHDRGESFIEQLDAVIVEGSHPSIQIHYLLAEAMCLQKPALCLYDHNSNPEELLECLKHPNIPKWIKADPYKYEELTIKISSFLGHMKSAENLEASILP